MRLRILVLFVSMSFLPFYGQTEQYNQYMYNTAAFNPGFTNYSTSFLFSYLSKLRWIGVSGSPNIQLLTLNVPFSFHNSYGTNIKYRQTGFTSDFEAEVSYAYTIRVKDFSTLSFGIGLKGIFSQVQLSRSNAHDFDHFVYDLNNKFSPNISLGLFYQTNSLFFSASIPNILDRYTENVLALSVNNEKRFYLAGGYVFEMGRKFKIKPAFLTSLSPTQINLFNLSSNFLYDDRFSIGFDYQYDQYISVMSLFKITKTMFFGLSYERNFSEITNLDVNFGSYEFLLQIKLPNNLNHFQITSPNF